VYKRENASEKLKSKSNHKKVFVMKLKFPGPYQTPHPRTEGKAMKYKNHSPAMGKILGLYQLIK